MPTVGHRPLQCLAISLDLRLLASSSCQPSCANRHSTWPEGVLHYVYLDAVSTPELVYPIGYRFYGWYGQPTATSACRCRIVPLHRWTLVTCIIGSRHCHVKWQYCSNQKFIAHFWATGLHNGQKQLKNGHSHYAGLLRINANAFWSTSSTFKNTLHSIVLKLTFEVGITHQLQSTGIMFLLLQRPSVLYKESVGFWLSDLTNVILVLRR
jgi:hypothetical protein